VSLLLERYLAELHQEPFLIVPTRADVDRVERDLLRRTGALLGGQVGTFDDLFERVARGGRGRRRVATETERLLILRGVVSRAALDGLGASARFAGFADALAAAVAELESALLDPVALDGELAA